MHNYSGNIYDDQHDGKRHYCTKYSDDYRSSSYSRSSFHESAKNYSKYSRGERDKFGVSESTLCVPQRCRNPSKSTLCLSNHRRSSREEKSVEKEKNISALPYYIVPVLYVPHKPLYEAKQMIEPHIYKAYHCKSKNQLVRKASDRHNYPPKLSSSRSMLNLYSKKHHRRDYDDFYESPSKNGGDNYSFEHFDEYFKKYMDNKKSSSEISFCTEKSFSHIKQETSSKPEIDLASEKRNSISRNFPELFGLYATLNDAPESLRPKTEYEEPTWDSPRTMNVSLETELAVKSCISAQTSIEAVTESFKSDKIQENQGTQTVIGDIKKNVLVMQQDKVKKSCGKRSAIEEVPSRILDGNRLTLKHSDSQIDRMGKKSFGFHRSTPRFGVGKLTKSCVSSTYGPSSKSSRRNMNSGNTSLNGSR